VLGYESLDVSYPAFFEDMNRVGVEVLRE
jgi:hypothetical protein